MNTILEQLNQDHGNVARLLDILNEQVLRSGRGEPLDTSLLKSIMRYMTQYQDVFHHPREDLLFARIKIRSAGSVGEVQQLETEHLILASMGAGLHRGLVDHDDNDSNACGVATQIGEYAETLRNHMSRESAHVFPLAKIILSGDDWKAIDNDLKMRTDPLFGPAVESSYRMVLERLGSGTT